MIVSEVAKVLDLSNERVRQLIKAKKLRAVRKRTGWSTYWDVERTELERFRRSRRVKARAK